MHKNVFGRITLKKLQCFANVRSIGCVINQNASSCKKPNYIINTRQFSVPKIAKPGTFDPLAMEIKDIDGVYRKVRYIDVGVRDDPNPIVMLGGTAQTIDTFGPHLRSISRIRRLIIPELRCQGSTELLSSYCTMEQQVEDFDAIMHNLGIIHVNDAHGMKINKKIDIVGFSFGGRVAMSLAAYRKYINRLSVTGVPYTRPAVGHMIMTSWLESLQSNHIQSCYWSFLLNGYSTAFLEKHAPHMSLYINAVAKGNPDNQRLIDLISHAVSLSGVGFTQDELEADPYSIVNVSKLITCPVQVISANEDRIAGVVNVKQLADNLDSCETYEEMEGGHLVLFESPNLWRKSVLNFLK